ncbi:hypothetical protein SAMN03080617_00551 [Algoriphagus alkaliphilus]|uniref:Uncharacterized protein n=1 Tax=Algoriphagus alkaliphilus TaxID=279824 RepID=A0A1G5VNW9_9BACT|nr:hypothetical protein [Algoriphagus alkaliphilus]MBA4301404.1 hypothetical protein [Cyclobacterium sp.]SDA46755.1 hypothetical protein SAMN03080617_00551 [Algoriphagus alkaliphilus]
MRTLSPQEIARIDQRLESLKIQYLEIYHELRDHYFTELEKKPTEEFEVNFQQLNETFAWSVVKKMEKELEKNVSKQVLVAQLKFLKFWNRGINGLLISFASLSILVICIIAIPASELLLVFLAIIICTSAGVFIIKRDALSFSLRHKPISVRSTTVLKRVGILNNLFVWIYVMPNIFSDGAILTNTLFVVGMGIVTVFSLLYSISLLAISSDLSVKRNTQ